MSRYPTKGCPVWIWDGPYRMRCDLVLIDGKCRRHGVVGKTPKAMQGERQLLRMMAAFDSMTEKAMTGHLTWGNLQTVLTNDELALFWVCLNIGKSGA